MKGQHGYAITLFSKQVPLTKTQSAEQQSLIGIIQIIAVGRYCSFFFLLD
jgi:hypothetical protein